jgi:hypothetical protein
MAFCWIASRTSKVSSEAVGIIDLRDVINRSICRRFADDLFYRDIKSPIDCLCL